MRDLEKAGTCVYQANYHLICATKYRRKVLVGMVKVRLEELLEEIADRYGYQLLTARVHDGDHMHLFVSAPPRASIPEMMRVFKCVTVKLLFTEFPEIKKQLWGGHSWSEGYAIRTTGNVTSIKIEERINKT